MPREGVALSATMIGSSYASAKPLSSSACLTPLTRGPRHRCPYQCRDTRQLVAERRFPQSGIHSASRSGQKVAAPHKVLDQRQVTQTAAGRLLGLNPSRGGTCVADDSVYAARPDAEIAVKKRRHSDGAKTPQQQLIGLRQANPRRDLIGQDYDGRRRKC